MQGKGKTLRLIIGSLPVVSYGQCKGEVAHEVFV